MDTLPAFIGRFHPVWVHLPIGILLLLGVLELAGLASRLGALPSLPTLPPRLRTLILALGALSAAAAALMGRMLASTGDYDPAAVARHQSLGYWAAGAALAALLASRSRRLYAPVLAAALLLLVLAGHAGGEITHGGGFLTARMPPALAGLFGIAVAPPVQKPAAMTFAEARVFPDAVEPILRERCVGCHGPEKQNGGLRLDSWDLVAKGGKHGPVLSAPEGTLLKRIDLPSEEKEHMPPRGKPQLSDDDLAVLEWWAAGAVPPARALAGLELPAAIDEILRQRLGGAAPAAPPSRAATLALAARISARTGVLVRSVSPDGPWIDVSARQAGRAFGDDELGALAPVASAVQWLDLGGTSVTDKGLAAVANMGNLERLHLDGTRVSDPGLSSVGDLRKLTYLNLMGTAVTDQGIAALRGLPRLRSLYVWQTAVTPAAVRSLGEALVDTRKIARWRSERDALGRAIDAERFHGDTGDTLRPVPEPAAPDKASPKTPVPSPK